MNSDQFFKHAFHGLTGNSPLPWQRELFRKLIAGDWPDAASLPTGLGKTMVMAVWLIAFAHNSQIKGAPKLPRRLAYIVNRRTVVDQATAEAEKLRKRIAEPTPIPDPQDRAAVEQVAAALTKAACQEWNPPLAISTLRGEFADNGEWRLDPARPAIIVGTVDMIGSRVLFSGYGLGFKLRPYHAGLLGQDTFIVHDEAHLEPSFQKLLEFVRDEHSRVAPPIELPPFRVMELTATTRGTAQPFTLTPEDYKDRIVKQRIEAEKRIRLHTVSDEKKELADKLAELALVHRESGQAILVFTRKVDDVKKVVTRLKRENSNVASLTGTMRGLERDQLATENKGFARFLPEGDRKVSETTPGTVYLVCTSAGEVGVNISADHLVCDLSSFDSMAQRFGRVNRFGTGSALIDIVAPEEFDLTDLMEERRKRTLTLLSALPESEGGRSASPRALGELPGEERINAFAPTPKIPASTAILVESWATTSARGDELPGRPPIADWLHGVPEYEPPETYVAWRSEVELFRGDLLRDHPPADLLEDYPLKPHELLRDRRERVLEQLQILAGRTPDSPVWVMGLQGDVTVQTLSSLTLLDRQKKPLVNLADCIVILPPSAGGLQDGLMDANSDQANDVADEWRDVQRHPLRRRITSDEPAPVGWRLVRKILLNWQDDEVESTGEELEPVLWRWYVSKQTIDGDSGSRYASEEQLLTDHQHRARDFAASLGNALDLVKSLKVALQIAAVHHDDGKSRPVWQVGIGNPDWATKLLAKSGEAGVGVRHEVSSKYRHEFGSLLDLRRKLQQAPEHADQSELMRDLILHSVAAHHGRGRPYFPDGEAFDPHPDHGGEVATAEAREVPRRFARLQRKFGPWGLAWLESLLRASDYLASTYPKKEGA